MLNSSARRSHIDLPTTTRPQRMRGKYDKVAAKIPPPMHSSQVEALSKILVRCAAVSLLTWSRRLAPRPCVRAAHEAEHSVMAAEYGDDEALSNLQRCI